MAAGVTIDLLAAVNAQRREAKEERARAMDGIVEVLFERAEARSLLDRWCAMGVVGGPVDRAALAQETLLFLRRTDAAGGKGEAEDSQTPV